MSAGFPQQRCGAPVVDGTVRSGEPRHRSRSPVRLMRERIEAMKAIWTQDDAEYYGAFVDFDPIHLRIKPVEKPHPPTHVGGALPGGMKRALRTEMAGFRCSTEATPTLPATSPRSALKPKVPDVILRCRSQSWASTGRRPAAALRRRRHRPGGLVDSIDLRTGLRRRSRNFRRGCQKS